MSHTAMEEVTAYVRSKLMEELATKTSMRTLGKTLKTTHVTLRNIRDRKTASIKASLLERFAKHLGVTMSALYHDAHGWASEHPEEIGRAPESEEILPADRYPARQLAARFARENEMDEEIIRSVLGWEAKDGESLIPDDWWQSMKEALRRKRLGLVGETMTDTGPAVGLHNVDPARRKKTH